MLQRVLADKALVGEVREGAVVLAHGEGEPFGAHLHATQHAVHGNGLQQILQARRANADLHGAVHSAGLVVQRHADVLAQLPGYLVGLRFLHHRVRALEQLAELGGLVLGVLAQGEVRVGGVRRGHHAVPVVREHVLDHEDVGQPLQVVAVRKRGVLVQDVAGHAHLAQIALVVLADKLVHARLGALGGLDHLGGALVVGHGLGR